MNICIWRVSMLSNFLDGHDHFPPPPTFKLTFYNKVDGTGPVLSAAQSAPIVRTRHSAEAQLAKGVATRHQNYGFIEGATAQRALKQFVTGGDRGRRRRHFGARFGRLGFCCKKPWKIQNFFTNKSFFFKKWQNVASHLRPLETF